MDNRFLETSTKSRKKQFRFCWCSPEVQLSNRSLMQHNSQYHQEQPLWEMQCLPFKLSKGKYENQRDISKEKVLVKMVRIKMPKTHHGMSSNQIVKEKRKQRWGEVHLQSTWDVLHLAGVCEKLNKSAHQVYTPALPNKLTLPEETGKRKNFLLAQSSWSPFQAL